MKLPREVTAALSGKLHAAVKQITEDVRVWDDSEKTLSGAYLMLSVAEAYLRAVKAELPCTFCDGKGKSLGMTTRGAIELPCPKCKGTGKG